MTNHHRPFAVGRATFSLSLAVGFLVAGCSKFQNAPPLEFRTDTVVRTNLTQSVTATGQILPTRQIQVGSQISGIITEIKADYNSFVKEGDVLAKIDPATYERALARADADLASCVAQQEQSDFAFKQAKELFGRKLISESDYVLAKVNQSQAISAVKMREAALESAKVDLQRTTIYSPIKGMVISRAVEAGQTVAASFSTPTMFQIAEDLHKMQIQLAVSEADIGNIENDQRVDFSVDAYPGRKFSGTISQVRFEPITNQNVVTYTTVVAVSNSDLKLRPGMTASAAIITSEKTNVLRVAASAVRFTPPAGVIVLPATNVVSTNDVVRPARPAGMPTPPWAAEGRRPNEGEREKWMASLTPEQRQQAEEMRKRFQQMREQGGGGGAGGGGPGGGMGGPGMGGAGGAPRRDVPEGPTVRTVYVPVEGNKNPEGKLTVQAVTVKVGTMDISGYEILEGLPEGLKVVIGTKGGPPATAATPGAPAPSPFGGGGRRF